MYVIQWFLLRSCLFGALISLSGASVLLKIVGGQTSFEEKSEVQLICTISPYNNIMTWFVDNDNYADCIGGSCGPSPNKPYTFTFNFDEAGGKFRLTIDSVNSSHANLLFACDDGNERKDITFDVTPGQISTSISNTETSTSSSKPVNSITGTGTNQSAVRTSLSSVSISDSSTITTVQNKGEIPIKSDLVPLIIAGACVGFISFIVLLCYYIFLNRNKKARTEKSESVRYTSSRKNKPFADISQSSVL